MNLKTHSELNDVKEKVSDLQKLVKKKDSQIEDLKALLEEAEHQRINFEKLLKDKK